MVFKSSLKLTQAFSFFDIVWKTVPDFWSTYKHKIKFAVSFRDIEITFIPRVVPVNFLIGGKISVKRAW